MESRLEVHYGPQPACPPREWEGREGWSPSTPSLRGETLFFESRLTQLLLLRVAEIRTHGEPFGRRRPGTAARTAAPRLA